jgi:mono/diheme cytochrome c family protein
MKLFQPSRSFPLYAALTLAALAGATHYLTAQSTPPAADATTFATDVKPFLTTHCVKCHNTDNPTAGVRVDHLDASLDERHIRLWEGIRHRVENGTMPPKGLPKPKDEERQKATAWIGQGLEIARLRPAPKNGITRRLTVSQYRNTLRDLLSLEDEVTDILPPDAISADGFVNNNDTLQLSPLLLEAYFEIANKALSRAIVDPQQKPVVQNFRMDFGTGINKNPIKEKLVLGAGSALLDPSEFTVTELTPAKPFAFTPFRMRTKYRFIEGYQGNDTVRGWRDFDSIYHSVFADMRGSGGYPKGKAHSVVPDGLLLRPAIPNDEIFEGDGTYGPKANFKIPIRELPDNGRFRVTVTAAKYNDGLMLDKDTPAAPASTPGAIAVPEPTETKTIQIPKPGVYQVDIYRAQGQVERPPTDSSKITQSRIGVYAFDEPNPQIKLNGNAALADSPFGKALSLKGGDDFATVPRSAENNLHITSFTISLWINPSAVTKSGILAAGALEYTPGWVLDIPDNRGSLRFATTGPDGTPNGTITTPPGVLRPNTWQHITISAPRLNQSRIYVNGYQVAEGNISPAPLDNPNVELHFGRVPKQPQSFKGLIDDVRIYTRVLAMPEIQALIEPGRKYALPPPERIQDITVSLGDRQFSGTLQAGFLHVRLPAGPLAVKAKPAGVAALDRLVLTPVTNPAALQRLAVLEKRVPRLGVHLGFRRDCGSSLYPVGKPVLVPGTNLARFTFEGVLNNYPQPNVEKDNVNYLAGVKEFGIRSEYTDGRDMPRLLIRTVEFEGPFLESWPPPAHRNLFPARPAGVDDKTYATQVIRSFATRAWRRPVAPVEVNRLTAVYAKAAAGGASFTDAVKDAFIVTLTSPQFLFLVEQSSTPKPEPLSPHELASKLSYFLTNSPPDRTTLALAASGTLSKNISAEIDRLVASPRFSRFTNEFVQQWLALDKFAVLEPDKKLFPNLTRDVRAELKKEPIQFVEHLFRNNLPAAQLISSDYIVANETVANYYGLGNKTEGGFDFKVITHNKPELGGVLTQASLLAGLSDGRESNPIKRGAWLARRIIAEPPSDPPPNVPALQEDTKGLTLRQRLEQHRSGTVCMQCHLKIDPWGVALEQYDANGLIKPKPADASSKLPDSTVVNNIDEFRKYLAQDRIDQVAFSVLKHLATYACGRTLTYNEVNYLKTEGKTLRASGYRMRDMIQFVAASPIFREK